MTNPTDRNKVVVINSKVAPSLSKIISKTFILWRNEKPKSNENRFFIYIKSCSGIDLSRPKFFLSISIYSGVADPDSPASTSAASPGANCKRRKFTIAIPNKTGIA